MYLCFSLLPAHSTVLCFVNPSFCHLDHMIKAQLPLNKWILKDTVKMR